MPVKIGDMDLSGLSQGLDAAAKNVRDEGRQKQAAVLISAGSEKVVDEHKLGDDEVVYQSQNDYIGILADLGVSTIVATGNNANEKDGNGKLRLEPDTLPDILAKHHPIILVGNVDWDGKLWASSQRGDLVTSNAMGVDVTCVGKSGKKMTDTGTSFGKNSHSNPYLFLLFGEPISIILNLIRLSGTPDGGSGRQLCFLQGSELAFQCRRNLESGICC